MIKQPNGEKLKILLRWMKLRSNGDFKNINAAAIKVLNEHFTEVVQEANGLDEKDE